MILAGVSYKKVHSKKITDCFSAEYTASLSFFSFIQLFVELNPLYYSVFRCGAAVHRAVIQKHGASSGEAECFEVGHRMRNSSGRRSTKVTHTGHSLQGKLKNIFLIFAERGVFKIFRD